MKTKAVRLYGKNDLRLEEFELPEIGENEMLAKVVSDSLCMSSYKAAIQGADHKRVPGDIDKNPVIIGHEFCGEIVQVGKGVSHLAQPGDKFTVQPAMFYKGSLEAPGYSYQYYGGDATYIILPPEVFETDTFLKYDGDAFFYGSLAEPMSCIAGGAHVMYHTVLGNYNHAMDIKEGGSMAILAGVGPMGLGMIDYMLHRDRKPAVLTVTDIDDARLARAQAIYTVEHAKELGVALHYVNTKDRDAAYVKGLTGGAGYDDVYVMAPVKPVVEMGDSLLAHDGCMNFFAGPSDQAFSAEINCYNIHYAATHVCSNSGGNTDDMREVLGLMGKGRVNPVAMITHVGGLNAVAETTLNLPHIPGGKKLIYTQIDMPLAAISDFEALGKTDEMFRELAGIVAKTNGLWSAEAEAYLLAHAKAI